MYLLITHKTEREATTVAAQLQRTFGQHCPKAKGVRVYVEDVIPGTTLNRIQKAVFSNGSLKMELR